MALALLMAPLRMLPCTRHLAAIAAASFLIAFDRYARGGDMLAARKSELRKPIQKQQAAAACWSLTMFPVSHDLTSKTNLQDLTVAIGSTHSERAWLSEVAEALHRRARARARAPYLRRLHSLSSSDLTLTSSAPAVIVRELKGQL